MHRTMVFVALVALLAGCAGPSGGAREVTDDPTLVTDPSQGRMDPSMGPHLHDYWGSAKEKDVVDAVAAVRGVVWGGESIAVAEFRPDSGKLVPQGASEVRVTLSWTDAQTLPPNNYGATELWVKRANESLPQRIAEVASGDTVVVPTGNGSNDLPHQLLSAWSFHLVMHAKPFPMPGPAVLYNVSYTGDVTLKAVAVRGTYAIPLFPGHPDQWHNRTEIPLLTLSGDMMFDGDTASGNWRCYFGNPGCPFVMVPEDGAIVPIDADHVTVVLERQVSANPTRMGVKFHSALTREFEAPPAPEETMERREYTIPVGDGGDGPYAQQSQWEFLFYASDPVPDKAVYEQFTLTITAYKDAGT